MPETTVAVLGTGIMGRPMAANLAAAGLRVRAWHRIRDRGRRSRSRRHDAQRRAAVHEVVESALPAVKTGAVWLRTSTVGPEWTGLGLGGRGRCGQQARILRQRAMIEGEYPLAFAARHAAKDARLVLDAAAEEVDLAGTRAALAHPDAAIAAGHGDDDMATLYPGLEGRPPADGDAR